MNEKLYRICLCVLFFSPHLGLGISYFVKRYRERHSKIWLSSDMFIQNGCVYKINESGEDDAE